MPAYVTMPKLSDTMTEGTLVKWLKKEGDAVSIDEDIAEVETDKATMAMPAFDEGIIHKIYVKEGEAAPLGATLALILEDGEEPPENADTPPAPEVSEESDAPKEAAVKEKPSSTPVTSSKKSASPSKTGGLLPDATTLSGERAKASPLAKRLAEEHGINVGTLRGSGPGGRVVKDDVLMAAAGGFSGGGGGGGLGLNAPVPSRGDETLPLSGMRKVIAARLLESKTTIPHFYLNVEIDAEPMMQLRSKVNEASVENGGPKYTVNDFIMRATVMASVKVPQVNASFAGDAIQQHGEVNLSVAVAIDDGLVTPVIFSAQEKNMRQLSEDIRDLAGRARDKKLTPDEMQGGTITISNLGSYGVNNFDAIINPPQAAILSIGTISKQPVVNAANQIVPGMRMWVGMSCDHRVIDGAVGATFMAEFKRLIENPVLLVV